MSGRARDLLKMSVIVAVTFALGLTIASAFNLPRPGMAEPRTASILPRIGTGSGPGLLRSRADGVASFADIVDRINPSVVYIQVGQHQRVHNPRDIPPEFQDFFRRFQVPQDQYRQGSGTGFIISRDGYIVTNNHVVADAEKITVKLHDNREFDARLVGRDPNTDVAVIKIDATGLSAVNFGDADQTRVGDWVLAFGNPLGFTFTVTAGIVSAKGRGLPGLQDDGARLAIQDFIQTDAAINPGNSGGPLVDLNGNVVGINAAIASQTGFYSGYGFAIPINLARRVVDDLIAKGHVDRAILGINIVDASADDAASVGLTDVSGVLVSQFPPDSPSPAKDAGLQIGDVIVAVNDTAVQHSAQLQQMVGFRHAGDVVRVTVVRRENGRTGVRHTFNVRLASGNAVEQTASGGDSSASNAGGVMEGRLGIRIEPVSSDLVQQAHLTDSQRGLVVTDVEEGGPAFQKLLPPSAGRPDIILQLNDTRVRTMDEFKRALQSAPRGSVVQLRVLNVTQDGSSAVRVVNIRSR